MLITKDFVVIHQPKTGGTFVIKSITDILHEKAGIKKESFLHKALRKSKLDYTILKYKTPFRSFPHQPVSSIPKVHANMPVVSVIRNPFRKWISEYNFNFWFRHPEYYIKFGVDIETVRKIAPTFMTESQTFLDYILALNQFLTPSNQNENYQYGYLTTQFIKFYCRNSEELLNSSNITKQQVLDQMYNVTLLTTENLREDLIGFLKAHGYSENTLKQILNEKLIPEKVGFQNEPELKTFYSNDLFNYVTEKEGLLLEIFPTYKQSLL